MPGASHASAGTVSLKPDPSLPEFEKILLFVFALGPDLASDLAGQKPVPFLGGLRPSLLNLCLESDPLQTVTKYSNHRLFPCL